MKTSSKKSPCIFLDRDGVINKAPEGVWVTEIHQFEFIPLTVHAIMEFKKAGFLVCVITNQGGIENGFISHAGLSSLHDHMQRELHELIGCKFDGIYYCPHHEAKCQCRKPLPGMFWQAAQEFNIDFDRSVMIGDKRSDVAAGVVAGCKESILLRNGTGPSMRLVTELIRNYA